MNQTLETYLLYGGNHMKLQCCLGKDSRQNLSCVPNCDELSRLYKARNSFKRYSNRRLKIG